MGMVSSRKRSRSSA